MPGSSARISDQMTEPFPGAGGARDQDVGAEQPQQPRRPVLAPADRQPGQIHPLRDRQGRDRVGERVAADQLQHDQARRDRADPAQMHPEAVRDAFGPVGEVGRGLPGHQLDRHPVHRAARRSPRPAPGIRTRPRYSGARPVMVITACQRRR